jgi:hypothetical protein
VVHARINPESGLRDPDGRISEYFYQEFLPAERDGETAPVGAPAAGTPKPQEEVKSQLF